MRYFEKIFHVIVISGFIGLVAGAAHANSFTTTGDQPENEIGFFRF